MRKYITRKKAIEVLKEYKIDAELSDTGLYVHVPNHFVSISNIKEIELHPDWVDIRAVNASYTMFFNGMTHMTVYSEREQ